jgi:hypothetical protein
MMRILIILLAVTAMLGASPTLAASPCTGAKMSFDASRAAAGATGGFETHPYGTPSLTVNLRRGGF